MESPFLTYYRHILDKVSFDPALLAKEYCKAVQALEEREVHLLNQWLAARGHTLSAEATSVVR